MRMNTESRRAVFCVVMGAEDFADALDGLTRLPLAETQQREIPRVLLECCLQETAYNPYYETLAAKLCERAPKKHRLALQLCVWDHVREVAPSAAEGRDDAAGSRRRVEKPSVRRVAHLARFVAGALVTRVEDETWRCVTHERKLGGATLGAFDAYLLSRGMRTLELRVKRQSATALWLANALKDFIDKVREDSGVEAGVVLYPGLVPGFVKQCKEHDVEDECTSDGSTKRTYHGGMMSLCFYDFLGLRTDEKKVRVERLVAFCRTFATSCKIWTCATSLGGFESLIEHLSLIHI